MICRRLRFATFLAPGMYPVYEFISRHVGRRLGVATELTVGQRYHDLAGADVSFVCGLAYIELCGPGRLPLAPVAAPVLAGSRSRGRPIYFSDVIVRRDSPFRTFADLRGASWCFNERLSHSGYGITRYRLVEMKWTGGFFGRVIEAGFHDHSIRLVRGGEVDASAIDCHVLALALRDDPALAREVRVIDSLGPSTIQPVVVAGWLPDDLRDGIRQALVDLGNDQQARTWLDHGLLDRFVAVDDSSYDDLRRMQQACAEAGFLTLR
ncbi:MAG TPA: PhnD/SsuA/transferrin family substrate-binding protein [Gemmataceae bacterium]|jgi:phosphonate transport system substrate-binding protein|nr:PhnD/SsuA/transferrin family substrate-binding protein [Gemmataceae bacterium]